MTILAAGRGTSGRGRGTILPLVAAMLLVQPASAEVATEVTSLSGSQVTLYLHPFLAAEELATLRLVATNEQALSLFVTSREGHAALAISESDGFIRDGQPAKSAIALADFASAEAARAAALAGCDAARTGTAGCVVVLEVGPKQ